MNRYPDLFCQRDARWSDCRLGNSKLTIGRVGCKTVCQTIGHNKIAPDNHLTPEDMARVLKYTPAGLMYHNQNYPDMKFVKRVWFWHFGIELKSAINSKKSFAIIAVNKNSHFVFPYYMTAKGIMIIDPWDGKIKLLHKSYIPCGYEIMERI